MNLKIWRLKANTTLSLENKGVPRLGNPVARGNHEVLVKVKLPTRITDGERELLEGLASQYSDKNINSSSGQVRRATRTPFGNFTQVAECPSCNGAGQIIADPCISCGGNGVKQVRKKLRINIPAGVDTGTKLRVSGEGNVGLKGGPPWRSLCFYKG